MRTSIGVLKRDKGGPKAMTCLDLNWNKMYYLAIIRLTGLPVTFCFPD
jgi:hypothetical protein